MEDRTLLEMYLNRSENAVAETWKRYGSLLIKVASNFLSCPEDIEECVNDTYLALWNSIPPNEPLDMAAYACRTVRNLAVKKYRYTSAEKRNSMFDAALDELGDCLSGGRSPEEELDASETAALINSFLGTLDPEDRNMFMLRYWYGCPLEETAERFGRSRHYVSVRLSRIRKKLRDRLRREEVFP